MQTTSLTLLDAVKGNPNAPEWGRFTRLYQPLLERWAIRNGFQPADAADLAQDILLKLLSALPSYRRVKFPRDPGQWESGVSSTDPETHR